MPCDVITEFEYDFLTQDFRPALILYLTSLEVERLLRNISFNDASNDTPLFIRAILSQNRQKFRKKKRIIPASE